MPRRPVPPLRPRTALVRGAVLVAAAWLGLSAAGAVEAPAVDLTYEVPAGLSCPDENAFRQAVSARLGFDPWRLEAGRTVRVRIAPYAEGLRAHLLLEDDVTGEIAGERHLEGTGTDCGELVRGLELAVSIAVDPLHLARGDVDPPSEVRPAVAEPNAAGDDTGPATGRASDGGAAGPATGNAPDAGDTGPMTGGAHAGDVLPAAPPTRIQLRAGGGASLGSAPDVAFGGVLAVAVAHGRLSLALEGRLDARAYRTVSGGQVSAANRWGLLEICFAPGGPAAACVLGGAGIFDAAGHDLADARRIRAPMAVAGGRARLAVPFGDRFGAAVYGDLLAHLTRKSLRNSRTGDAFWTMPPASVALGFSGWVVFP